MRHLISLLAPVVAFALGYAYGSVTTRTDILTHAAVYKVSDSGRSDGYGSYFGDCYHDKAAQDIFCIVGMCPNQTGAEWGDLVKNYPADYAKAKHFEREIQKRDPAIYLEDAKASGGDCMSGFCFT